MKKLTMTPPNEQILNQICQWAAKGAQQLVLEQLENMIKTLNSSMEEIPDAPQNNEQTTVQSVSTDAKAEEHGASVHSDQN